MSLDILTADLERWSYLSNSQDEGWNRMARVTILRGLLTWHNKCVCIKHWTNAWEIQTDFERMTACSWVQEETHDQHIILLFMAMQHMSLLTDFSLQRSSYTSDQQQKSEIFSSKNFFYNVDYQWNLVRNTYFGSLCFEYKSTSHKLVLSHCGAKCCWHIFMVRGARRIAFSQITYYMSYY